MRRTKFKMGFSRFIIDAVDRQKVHRAGGKNDNTVHLHSQYNSIARLADGRQPLEVAVCFYLNVHEQVQWAGRFSRLAPKL